MSVDKAGYLYLLRNARAPAGVLKMGRTNNPARRLSEYPANSSMIHIFGPVDDCHEAERHLIVFMKARFRASNFGREYVACPSPRDGLSAFLLFCFQELQARMPHMAVPMDLG
jgi:hypothetical protein